MKTRKLGKITQNLLPARRFVLLQKFVLSHGGLRNTDSDKKHSESCLLALPLTKKCEYRKKKCSHTVVAKRVYQL